MSSTRGKGPSLWVPRKSSDVQAPSKVWAVIWACSQSGGGCNLWDWDCVGGVLSTASGNPPSFGSGNHIYFCNSVEAVLSAHPNNHQPPTSPRGLWQSLHSPPGERKGYPLQYSCLGNPVDRDWQAIQSMASQRVQHDSATSTHLSPKPRGNDEKRVTFQN